MRLEAQLHRYRSTLLGVLSVIFVSLPAALHGGDAEEKLAVSFRSEIQPVLTKYGCNSGACHGAAAGKNGFKLSLRGYDYDADHSSLTRQAAGRRVNTRRPEESLLLKKALGQVPHGGGQRFPEDSREHTLLRDWIHAGAPGARAGEALVESIRVEPQEVTTRAGEKVRFQVLATYSDGSERDVTTWAKYSTTQDSVALVDEQGEVSVIGSGEAAITAWYQSKITYGRVLSPFPNEIPDEVYTKALRQNFIDELVLRKLRLLHLAPSPPASDLEFVRRLYLDLLGTLPEPRDALRFAANPSPQKRERLVDELLERSEFVDYRTYQLSDLLLVNGRKIPGDALRSFYEFIRGSVAENMRWDQFVREIITARGSPTDNGAAGYYVIHKDPIDMTETTSQAFLGLAITCARCHNHPLEKWTQDQYYGMANLFGRVKLKRSETRNEDLVLASATGNVLHPRLGRPVSPQPLDGEPLPLDADGDRREHLAAWLTAPENPYFGRATVNRAWKHFFGRGLVDPEDDLRLTNPASNEALLAAVARDFVENGYDIKHLIKTLVLSAAYQRTSRPHMGNDGDGIYFSHYVVRRLPAEVLLDSYSAATQVPTDFPGYPQGFRALQLRDSEVASYFLSTFGRPQRVITCSCERTDESSLPQMLHLSNGATLDKKLTSTDNVISRSLKKELSDAEIIDELYLRALTRFPAPEEMSVARKVVREATMGATETGSEASSDNETSSSDKGRREALEDLLWGLLSSKEFLFNK
jgi:hypothetical protein